MFRFPQKSNKLNEWLAACNFSEDVNIINKLVCSDHFEKKFLAKKKLYSNAVPTLNLPIDNNPYNFFDESVNTIDVNMENKETNHLTREETLNEPLDCIGLNDISLIRTKHDFDRDSNEEVCKRCLKNIRNVAYYRSKLKRSNELVIALEKKKIIVETT